MSKSPSSEWSSAFLLEIEATSRCRSELHKTGMFCFADTISQAYNLRVHNFKEQNFSVNKEAVITQRELWQVAACLWNKYCFWITLQPVLPVWWKTMQTHTFSFWANFYFLTFITIGNTHCLAFCFVMVS